MYRWRLCPAPAEVAAALVGVLAVGAIAYFLAPWLWLVVLGTGAGRWRGCRDALAPGRIDPGRREVVQKPSLIPRRRGGRWNADEFKAVAVSSFTFEHSTTWTVSLLRHDGSELKVQRSKREGQARKELEEIATALGLPLLDRTATEPRMTSVSEVASPLAARLRSKPEEAELLAYILANPPADARVSIKGEAGEAMTIAITSKAHRLRSVVLFLLLAVGTLAYVIAFVRFTDVNPDLMEDLMVLALLPGMFIAVAWFVWVLRNLSYDVRVEPETVQIRRKVLGVPVWFSQIGTAGVREVVDDADTGGAGFSALTIRTRDRVLHLGVGLSEEQKAWLSAALSAVIASQSEASSPARTADTT